MDEEIEQDEQGDNEHDEHEKETDENQGAKQGRVENHLIHEDLTEEGSDSQKHTYHIESKIAETY